MLINLLPSVGVVKGTGTEVWLFGSAYSEFEPRDIDILLIFDKTLHSHADAIRMRQRLAEAVAKEAGRQADILLLSQNEAKETAILSRIQAKRLA